MSSITGKCLRGQITVSITNEAWNSPNGIGLCYCTNCRQSTGSLGSINTIVPEAAAKVTGHQNSYLGDNADSGSTVRRAFCDNYGSPIYSSTQSGPGVLVVKCGLFADVPKPSMELCCKSKPARVQPIDGIKQFDKMPTEQPWHSNIIIDLSESFMYSIIKVS